MSATKNADKMKTTMQRIKAEPPKPEQTVSRMMNTKIVVNDDVAIIPIHEGSPLNKQANRESIRTRIPVITNAVITTGVNEDKVPRNIPAQHVRKHTITKFQGYCCKAEGKTESKIIKARVMTRDVKQVIRVTSPEIS